MELARHGVLSWSAVLLPMSLLAHHFETTSCHKCALSLLALVLIEISLATSLEYFKSADCGVCKTDSSDHDTKYQPILYQALYFRHAQDIPKTPLCSVWTLTDWCGRCTISWNLSRHPDTQLPFQCPGDCSPSVKVARQKRCHCYWSFKPLWRNSSDYLKWVVKGAIVSVYR